MAAPKRNAAKGGPARAKRGTGADGKSDAFTERRRALVKVAAELFAEQGFRSTTVRQIGAAAGVLSGSLYHHFESKEAIADQILSEYLDGIIAEYQEIIDKKADPTTTLRELVHAAFASLGPYRAAITVLQNERDYLSELPRFAYLSKAENDVRRMWVRVLEEGVELGQLRDDIDPKIAYRFLRDSIWVAVRWFTPSGRLTADELSDQYLKMVMGGLAT